MQANRCTEAGRMREKHLLARITTDPAPPTAQIRTMACPLQINLLPHRCIFSFCSLRCCLSLVPQRSTAIMQANRCTEAGRKREKHLLARITTDPAPPTAQIRTMACPLQINLLPHRCSFSFCSLRCCLSLVPQRSTAIMQANRCTEAGRKREKHLLARITTDPAPPTPQIRTMACPLQINLLPHRCIFSFCSLRCVSITCPPT